jgi:hypothetical protein
MEEIAFNHLQESNWLELYDLWLRIVLQGLRSQRISSDSTCFQTAQNLLNQISAGDSNIDSLRLECQRVINEFASQKHYTAL